MFPYRSRIPKYIFAAFVIVVLLYAYFEARNMLYGPQITIANDAVQTVHEEMIEVSGTAANVVEITLGGEKVFLDETGAFTEQRLLAEGLNRLVFEARDKFDRERREVLEIVYQPREQTPAETDTIEQLEE